ncbi:MAG: hypothetical protein IKM07_04415, partial [Clostridia bacterium]|nr:hypothetical protein [Clostridia bacterium]
AHGLSCGWFCCLTVKSGPSGFTPILRADGTEHPFASCPLDPGFSSRLSADIARFAEIAKPDFIFLEDDFSIGATNGCFCKHHLAEFAARMGKNYTREELLEILSQTTPEALAINREWRRLKHDCLVSLAAQIRAAVHEKSPEIPIGLEQSGAADVDGDSTLDVTRALAGPNHTPFVRLHGTFYCGFHTKLLPKRIFHSLWFTQHLPQDVLCYHETDTYPHMRFYSSGKQMKAMLSAVYSCGMVGSLYFAQEFVDKPWEEDAYGKVFAAEQARFTTLAELAAQCRVTGVEVNYDPFYNTLQGDANPFWAEPLGRFGIPFTTEEADVAFWDARQARYSDDATVRRYLSKGLILDGDAARILCERGYGEYLGITAGEDVLKARPRLVYDLGACEIITDDFVPADEGRELYSAHDYCPAGNGVWCELSDPAPETQIISCGYDFSGNIIAPTMTLFQNALGGQVVVMSLTLKNNPSQAIFNNRRQRLLQRLAARMSDEYPFVENAPDVYMIAQEPKADADFRFILTLINLCDDDAENLSVYLPPKMRNAKAFCTIAQDGSITELGCERHENGIRLLSPLRYCEPVYVIGK